MYEVTSYITHKLIISDITNICSVMRIKIMIEIWNKEVYNSLRKGCFQPFIHKEGYYD